MRAGLLTDTVTFYRVQSVISDTGASRETDVEMCTRHCCRDKQADKLMMTGIQEFRGGTVVLQLRYEAQLKEATEFEYEGSRYRVVGVTRRRSDNAILITGSRQDTR